VTYGVATITVTGDWQFFTVTGNIGSTPTDPRIWVYHSDANWPDTTIHVWGACCKLGTTITPDDYAHAPAGEQAAQWGWLAAQIRLAPKDRVLAIVTYDEPFQNRLKGTLPHAIKFMGGSRAVFEAENFKVRSAYLLVGKWGLGHGNGMEFYAGEVDRDPNAYIDVTVAIKNGMFSGTTGTPDVEQGADNSGNRIYGTGGLLPNWNLDILDSYGKPAGILPVESVSDRNGIAAIAEGLRIRHPSDTKVAYGFPAITIDDKQRYRVVITHRSGQSTTTGLYLRFNETSSPLGQGKTHVGLDGAGPAVQLRSSYRDLVGNGPMPGPSWVVDEYIYTPTPGTKYASFSMYHWGYATSFDYDVDRVQIIPIAKTASDIDYSDGTNVDALQPSMPNADNTRGAIESVVTINDQGAIQNASWDSGTKKIKIDFANQRIAIGDDVYGSSVPHVLQEYNGGNPRFEITNGDQSYIKFDSNTNSLSIGPETKTSGLYGYFNQNPSYITYFIDSYFGFDRLSATRDLQGGYVYLQPSGWIQRKNP